MKHQICVVGTGYVGMASAIGLATIGHQVHGYDIMAERVRSLQKGITPYREAGINEPLLRNLTAGRLRFFENLNDALSHAEFIIVCVGTPANDDGSCDLTDLYSAVVSLKDAAPDNAIVVLRSTVPPGTTEIIARRLAPLQVVYAPEFLREGSALEDFLNPDRIVVGAQDALTAERYLALFTSLSKPAIITETRNAELIKSCSNAFLALKVTFANQVANLCDGVGADALEVLRGVGADTRIGSRFLEPGIGFGGPCFEKDVKSLRQVSKQYDTGSDLFAATLQVNNDQPNRIIEMIRSELGPVRHLRIGVWGLAFKAGTDDVRDSMAVRIIDELLAAGASVKAFDPEVAASAFPRACEVASSALHAADSDVLLILTEWPEFRDVDLRAVAHRLERKTIIDGRNILDPARAEHYGLTYRGIGRKAVRAAEHEKQALSMAV